MWKYKNLMRPDIVKAMIMDESSWEQVRAENIWRCDIVRIREIMLYGFYQDIIQRRMEDFIKVRQSQPDETCNSIEQQQKIFL